MQIRPLAAQYTELQAVKSPQESNPLFASKPTGKSHATQPKFGDGGGGTILVLLLLFWALSRPVKTR